MTTGWTDTESDRLTELHGQGMALHSIAKEMGRSKRTVSKYAAELGLTFDRTRTAKAAIAVHVDNKARREALESRLLDIAAGELDAMTEEARVYSFGGADNHYAENWLEKPPPNDRRSIMQTASTAIQAANRLHDMNTDSRDLPAVDAWMQAMTGMGQP